MSLSLCFSPSEFFSFIICILPYILAFHPSFLRSLPSSSCVKLFFSIPPSVSLSRSSSIRYFLLLAVACPHWPAHHQYSVPLFHRKPTSRHLLRRQCCCILCRLCQQYYSHRRHCSRQNRRRHCKKRRQCCCCRRRSRRLRLRRKCMLVVVVAVVVSA